jgi:hypothetical protein
MTKLEAWVLHKSVLEHDNKFYSLGIYEMRDADIKAGWSYEKAAEAFRQRCQLTYARHVILEKVAA